MRISQNKSTEKLQELQKKISMAVQKPSSKKGASYNGEGDSKEDDVVPRFAINSVVKTYTRKRKPSEGLSVAAKTAESEEETNKTPKEATDEKVSIDLPNTAYITKSSRVIKKKIIWDPDQAASPIKKNKLSLKVDAKPSSSKIEAKVVKVDSDNKALKLSPGQKEKPSTVVKVVRNMNFNLLKLYFFWIQLRLPLNSHRFSMTLCKRSIIVFK